MRQAHLAAPNGQRYPTILIRSCGVLIGRGGDAERAEAAEVGLDYVPVGWKQVSRKHCRIVRVDRSWYVEQDPESKNGVYYKDEPRPIGPDRRVELMDDDCIHLVNPRA